MTLWGVPHPRVGAPSVAGVVSLGDPAAGWSRSSGVARMIKRHLDGIVTAVLQRVTNGAGPSRSTRACRS